MFCSQTSFCKERLTSNQHPRKGCISYHPERSACPAESCEKKKGPPQAQCGPETGRQTAAKKDAASTRKASTDEHLWSEARSRQAEGRCWFTTAASGMPRWQSQARGQPATNSSRWALTVPGLCLGGSRGASCAKRRDLTIQLWLHFPAHEHHWLKSQCEGFIEKVRHMHKLMHTTHRHQQRPRRGNL